MTLPVSTTWDLADFSGAALSSLLALGPSDLTVVPTLSPYFSYSSNFTVLNSQSADGVEASLAFSAAIPTTYTVDFLVRFPSLPHNLGDLATRSAGIVVANGTGRGIALYFAKSGIAVSRIDTFGGAVALPDTEDVTEAVSTIYHTVRIAVDGAIGRAYVFVGAGETEDPSLRWIVPVAATPPPYTDLFKLFVHGLVDEPVHIELKKLRLSSTVVIADYPPVADAGPDRVITQGELARLDARSSYDIEGAPLQFAWRCIDAPFGSVYAGDIGSATTIDDGDADGVTNIVTVDPAQLPDWLAIGDVLRLQATSYAITAIDTGTGDITVLFDAVPDNLSSVPIRLLRQSIILEPSAETTAVVPDVAGLYRFDLVVNDGNLDSEAAEVLVNVKDAKIPFGIEPEVGVLWQALGDEWQFFEGKDVFEEAWRGVAMILAGKMLEAWQYHYNSSIRDAQRIFQRKWIAYRTLEPETSPDTVTIEARSGTRLASYAYEGGPAATTGQTLTLRWYPAEGLAAESIDIVLSSGLLATTITEINAAVSGIPLQGLADATAAQLGLTTLQYEARGSSTSDGDGDGTTLTWSFTPSSLPGWVQANDIFVVRNTRHRIASINNGGGTLTVTADRIPDNASQESFRIYRASRLRLSAPVIFEVAGDAVTTLGITTGLNYLEGVQGVRITDQVYLVDTGIDLSSCGVVRNDLLVLNNGESFRIDRLLSDPLDAVSNQRVLVYDELPLDAGAEWVVPSRIDSTEVDYELRGIYPGDLAKTEIWDGTTATNAQGLVVAQKGQTLAVKLSTELYAALQSTDTFEVRFTGVRRRKAIPIPDDIVSIPRLQEIIVAAQDPTYWKEQRDYILEPFYRDTNSAPIPMLQFKDSVWIEPNLEPPDIFWAELTLFSNDGNVEDLFGRLVGFLRDDAATFPPDFNYVSGVAGLLYAQQRGPTRFAMSVGAQILLGQPFAEAAGFVEEIRTDYSPRKGRILIRDADGNIPTASEVIRAYYYTKNPLDVSATSGIAINTENGQPWALGDAVPQFSPLSTGVDVADTYNDPTWWIPFVRGGLMTEIEKFHTFLVSFNTDLVTLANVNLLASLITRIKPRYTKAILAGTRITEDELDPDDDLTMTVTIHPQDSLGDSRTFTYDDYTGDGTTSASYDDGVTYYDGLVDCPTDHITFCCHFTWGGGVISVSLPFYNQTATDLTGGQTGTPGNTFTLTSGMILAAGNYEVCVGIKTAGVVLP